MLLTLALFGSSLMDFVVHLNKITVIFRFSSNQQVVRFLLPAQKTSEQTAALLLTAEGLDEVQICVQTNPGVFEMSHTEQTFSHLAVTLVHYLKELHSPIPLRRSDPPSEEAPGELGLPPELERVRRNSYTNPGTKLGAKHDICKPSSGRRRGPVSGGGVSWGSCSRVREDLLRFTGPQLCPGALGQGEEHREESAEVADPPDRRHN